MHVGLPGRKSNGSNSSNLALFSGLSGFYVLDLQGLDGRLTRNLGDYYEVLHESIDISLCCYVREESRT